MERIYENRLVAFIDILGFKEMIYSSESRIDIGNTIKTAMKYFKKWESPDRWGLKLIEIEEDAQKKCMSDFEIYQKTVCTCFSDSIVISIKVNENKINEAFSTMIANLADMGNYLMKNGVLIRGAITIGNLHHDRNGVIYGSGLIEAYELESNMANVPRIILSKKLINSLNYPLTSKHDRYPYHQYLARFEDGCVGFHQMILLQVIQNSTVIEPLELKETLRKVKSTIINGLDNNLQSPKVYLKYQWLKKEYDKLIIHEEGLKEDIHGINESSARSNIHYNYIDKLYYDTE